MKNLAEFSQCDELIIRLKEIAAHILSTDNMRLVTRLCDSSCCAKLSFFSLWYFEIVQNFTTFDQILW